LGDETFGLLGIPIFGQIRNGNIRSLSCKGKGNRRPMPLSAPVTNALRLLSRPVPL